MNEEIKSKIFDQAQKCLDNLTDASGHLASYDMRSDTFVIAEALDLAEGLTEYTFKAQAAYKSEFAVYDEEHPPRVDRITGTIILDGNLALVFDDKGQVRFGPWRLLHPRSWLGEGDSQVQNWIDGVIDGDKDDEAP